jgi:glycosyltransferase involved in cell wall biosynthesis
MHIALLTQSIAPPLTGIGRYTFELATRLPNAFGVTACDLLNDFRWSSGAEISAIDAIQSGPAPQFSGFGRWSEVRQRVARSQFASNSYSLIAERFIRRNVALRRPQLLHCPNFYAPDVDCPLVVTVHDLSVLDHPEWHPLARAKLVARNLVRLNERAAEVIVDSHHTARRLTALTSMDPARVSVVHLAAAAAYRLPLESGDRPYRTGAVELKTRLRLPDQFTLCVSTLEPRKNLVRLIRAYRSLDRRIRTAIPLVLIGGRGWQDAKILHEVKLAETEGWLKYVGYVSEADLPLLYGICKVFIYPSLYEGFGLPVLEAMQCGAAVIASDATSLPEVGGDAVLYCEPKKEDSIRAVLAKTLSDAPLRAELSLQSIEQAKRFSWDNTVSGTINAYRRALTPSANFADR